MKKIIWSILIFIFTFSPLLVHAEEIKYGNLVTDESTIEDDFKLLGLDIDDWYQPTKYDYDKWYVIAMSEAYVDDVDYDIQTYFYLYNPVKYDSIDLFNKISPFTIDYNLDNESFSITSTRLLYDQEHLIYKIKGFIYDYSNKSEIKIEKISYRNYSTMTSYEFPSDFKATANHSKINGFSVELSFNSMLVIEDYLVVEENVTQDNTFKNFWNTVFSFEPTSMYVYFYNFNFPEHIEYDKVTYAKFKYDYIKYEGIDYNENGEYLGKVDTLAEVSRETRYDEEYTEKSNTLKVNENSMELTFPTFYLGNRVEDKQFGTLEVSNVEDFEYDCSILLGATYEWSKALVNPGFVGAVGYIYGEDRKFDKLDEIEILELHYENDGILYKCQVAGGKVDTEKPNENFGQGNATDQEDLFAKIKDWFKGIWNSALNWIKDIYTKYKIPLLIIGGLIIGGLLFVILKNLVVLAKFLWTIVYGIGYIIFYPFILIYRAIDKKKNE